MLFIPKLLKNPKVILILILLFAIAIRLYRLDYPNKFYFDEVYHAFTAKEYLKGSKEAWEYWATPPPGLAYEWTHPPLAKEIMTASMFITNSQDGWAWRLPGSLLGVLSVYLVYLLAITLLKDQRTALISAFIFSIDGLNFVQSRIGMNDIYFVTFSLLSILFFLQKKFFWSAIFLGFSLSSKWAAIYLFGIYLIMLLFVLGTKKDKLFKIPIHIIKTYGRLIIYFIFIPTIIYLVSYIPFFLLGHSFEQFIELQKQMWWYHTGLKATHGYSSLWWSWPLNLYPIWYFVDYGKDTIANIFSSGNPAVFLLGSLSILLTIYQTIRKRSKNLLIILLGFFAFWLPWSISPRIMFLYHFSPSVPFLALALGYQLNLGLSNQENSRKVISLLLFMFLSFVLIYPFLTGIPLPNNLVKLFFLTNLSKNP